MSEVEHQAYLEAMGLTQWVRRGLVQEAERPGDTETGAGVSVPDSVAVLESTRPVAEHQVCGQTTGTQDDWPRLKARVAQCLDCDLHRSRTQTVFGVGNEQADWMIIGEAPGADEDRQGEPFVGRAGQLLNAMLYALGLARETVYIANILKCRPPNNRDPRPEEVLRCEAYLKQQVALVNPKIILAVGRIAAHNLLKTEESLGRLRGKQYNYGETPLVVTYHPAYLLRNPVDKRKAWQDLLFAKSVLRKQC